MRWFLTPKFTLQRPAIPGESLDGCGWGFWTPASLKEGLLDAEERGSLPQGQVGQGSAAQRLHSSSANHIGGALPSRGLYSVLKRMERNGQTERHGKTYAVTKWREPIRVGSRQTTALTIAPAAAGCTTALARK